jgi:acetoin utilization protein AcuC
MWGRIAGHEIPDRLPSDAHAFMCRMECDLIDVEDIQEQWLTTIADTPYPGTIRDEIKSMVTDARTHY